MFDELLIRARPLDNHATSARTTMTTATMEGGGTDLVDDDVSHAVHAFNYGYTT